LLDYVEVWEGTIGKGKLLGVLCGMEIPSPIMSISNEMEVRFTTDFSGEDSRFYAEFVQEKDQGQQNIHECERNCVKVIEGGGCTCNCAIKV